MNSTTSRSVRQLLATMSAAGLFIGCADGAPVGPDARSTNRSSAADLTPAEMQAAKDGRFPDLGTCGNLKVDVGSKVTFHVLGVGVQIYRWNGTKWDFVSPRADLFADAGGKGLVGTHFGGPTWETRSGSRVRGTVTDHCTASPDAIDWLLLDATATGSGVFEQTNRIQRLNTVGGKAPSTPGSTVGQEVEVPYTADYVFYRAPDTAQ